MRFLIDNTTDFLNESITKVDDTYITYSVNDVLSFLEDKGEMKNWLR